MSIIEGFQTEYGANSLRREFVSRVLSDVMYENSYDKVNIPYIEPLSSYSEEILGKSPWPEWNDKCIFAFAINNYACNYEESNTQEVCLIPEGTVSITRWLADIISQGQNPNKKIFYNLHCFRNELISTLSETKKREFEQFGVEILNSANYQSDIEILDIVFRLLDKLGINNRNVRIRVNNIAIFNMLTDISCIHDNDVITIKCLLDLIAECHAGKQSAMFESRKEQLVHILLKYSISNEIYQIWESIINHSYCNINELYNIFPVEFHDEIRLLQTIYNHFALSAKKVEVDLSVIRSHQYYTGLSFEVDVITNNHCFFEIAGGGRYDRLVKSFLKQKNENIGVVPCTGFAFGMDRVMSMLNCIGIFKGTKILESKFKFE